MLKYLALIPALFALIKGSIEMVEAVSSGKTGPEKKQAVLDALQATWEGVQAAFGINVAYATIAPVIGLLIDLAVAIYNATGFFQKKAVATV